MDREELLKYILTKVRDFLNAGTPYSTQKNLATLSGISETTINRYASDEVDKLPNANTAFLFLKFFEGSEKIAAIKMKVAYPTWWKTTGSILSSGEKKVTTINKYNFSTPVHFLIFTKAQTSEGATPKWIEKNFGIFYGEKVKNELLANNLINMQSGTYKTVNDSNIFNDAESLHTMILRYTEAFNPDLMSTMAAGMARFKEVPEKTGIQVYKILLEAYLKIDNLVNSVSVTDDEKKEVIKLMTLLDWDPNFGLGPPKD